jgi:hypothetical protein
LEQQNCPAIYQEKCFKFLIFGSSGTGSSSVCSENFTITFWPQFELGMLLSLHCKDLSFWRYPSMDQMMLISGHVIQCGLGLIQGKIAWSFNLQLFSNCQQIV